MSMICVLDEWNKDSEQIVIQNLAKEASKYVKTLAFVCGMDDSCRSELDNPNVHRLLELSNHMLPGFGYG